MNASLAIAVLASLAQQQQPTQEQKQPQEQQAQQKPPIWKQGQTPGDADSKLAPFPAKSAVTPPGEIPFDKIAAPKGFKVELWAHGLPGGRQMARGDKGKIYVGTRAAGRVYEVTDHGDHRTVRTVVEKLTQPAGVAFRNGSLYVAAIDKFLRYDHIEEKPDVEPVDITAKFQFPPQQHHNWKFLAFGPDGKLYIPFGAPCNICEPPPEYAQIRRYDPDGSNMEVTAPASAIPSASTGSRRRRSCVLPTTGATGWERTVPRTSSIASRRPGSISAFPTATRRGFPTGTSRRRTRARASPSRSPCSARTPPPWE